MIDRKDEEMIIRRLMIKGRREDSSEVEERDCEATKIIDFSTIDKRRENFSANRVDRQKKQFQKQRNTRSKGKKRERLENIELNGELNPE